jgi:predicted nucleic acid-binding protein
VIIADTNAWIRFYLRKRTRDPRFVALIEDGSIVVHPYVYGELKLGGLAGEKDEEIRRLDRVPPADYGEVIAFVSLYRPEGITWVDANLLVSAWRHNMDLITTERALERHAARFLRARANPRPTRRRA